MTTTDVIIHLFCWVDDPMPPLPKHSQARLWPSKLVTIGLLFALKGINFRAFYCWLKHDYPRLLGPLPQRTRLLRLLHTHQAWTNTFLADPTFFTIIDSYGIELIHPWREGRSPAQVGKKGLSNHRWIVGIKLCWLVNNRGEVVGWAWDTANVHDQTFLPLVEQFDGQAIVLADMGFQCAEGIPAHLKLCRKGTWNERMLVEAMLAMTTLVCKLKPLFHRVDQYMEMHLAYISA